MAALLLALLLALLTQIELLLRLTRKALVLGRGIVLPRVEVGHDGVVVWLLGAGFRRSGGGR